MQKTRSIFLLQVASIFFIFSFVLVAASQETGIEISEILYAPRISGEWIEVVNTGDERVDLTALTLTVSSGADRDTSAITSHQGAPAILFPGSVAIIAADPTAFQTAYPTYSGLLFHAPVSLPDTGAPRITLGADGTPSYQTTYAADPRSTGTGASLHVTESGLVVAPATPGEVSRNPLEPYQVQPSVTVTTVTTPGGESTDTGVFLTVRDWILLRLFHTEHIPQLTADLYIGEQRSQRNFTESRESDDVQQVFVYEVQEDDGIGVLSYSAETEDGLVKEEDLVVGDKPVIIDTVPPVLTVKRQETHLDVSVDEAYLAPSLRYKVFDVGACSEEGYGTLPSDEQTVSIPSAFSSIRIALTESERQHAVCVVASDRAGNQTYALSSGIALGTTLADSEPISVRISEIAYSTSEGITTEWLEVTNSGNAPIDLTLVTLVDGDRSRTITHRDGPALIAPGSSAIIAKKPESFATDFPNYDGPLFRSPISLLDAGDTISLQVTETDHVLDSVTYSSSDGAKKDGQTLHVFDGAVSPGNPTPGQVVARSAAAEQPTVPGVVSNRPAVTVTHINGQAVPAGKNLFFTTEETARATFVISDDTTPYTQDTVISQYGLSLTPTAQQTTLQISDPVIRNTGDNAVRADYTVQFSQSSGGITQDNRVVLAPRVRDDSGQENDLGDNIVIVRNTTRPTLMNAAADHEIVFSGSTVIVPIRVMGVQMGDWLKVTYGGSCGKGLLPFIVRNGGYGITYNLEPGTYTDCTVLATNTAGNTSNLLRLTDLIVH